MELPTGVTRMTGVYDPTGPGRMIDFNLPGNFMIAPLADPANRFFFSDREPYGSRQEALLRLAATCYPDQIARDDGSVVGKVERFCTRTNFMAVVNCAEWGTPTVLRYVHRQRSSNEYLDYSEDLRIRDSGFSEPVSGAKFLEVTQDPVSGDWLGVSFWRMPPHRVTTLVKLPKPTQGESDVLDSDMIGAAWRNVTEVRVGRVSMDEIYRTANAMFQRNANFRVRGGQDHA